MVSEKHFEHYAQLTASWSCSVCKHVANGAAVNAVGNVGFTIPMGCCAECLYSKDRLELRASHLVERQPELLALLHLPVYGQATEKNGIWVLDRMAFEPNLDELAGQVMVLRNLHKFCDAEEELFVLMRGHALYFSVFHSGARFVPMWKSELDAKHKRNATLLDRVLFRVVKMPTAEIAKAASRQKHNYISMHMGQDTWETVIVNDRLDIEGNTLML